MGQSDSKDLLKFISHFGKEVVDKVLWLREFVWDKYPQTNELIYDNYNAVAIGWSPTDRVGHTFCSIAVGRTSKNIHFGFYWGSEIADPKKILLGEGNQYRYILVNKLDDFPMKYVTALIKDAYDNSMKKVTDKAHLIHGLTITKSISDEKRGEGKTKEKRLKTKADVGVKAKGATKVKAKSGKLKAGVGKTKKVVPSKKTTSQVKKKK